MQPIDQLQQIDRTQNIDSWNVRAYFLSRNPKVLFWTAMAIVVISLGVAWLVQKPLLKVITGSVDEEITQSQSAATDLQAELAKPQPSMESVVKLLPQAGSFWNPEIPFDALIARSQLSETEKLVANAYWLSLQFEDGFEPSADLLYYAHYVKPLPFANELIGDHHVALGNLEKAAAYYSREAKLAGTPLLREKLIAVAVKQKDRRLLKEIGADPAFTKEFKPEHRVYFAAQDRRWLDVVEPLKDLQTRLVQPVPATLAAVAGLVWFLVALQAIQPPGAFSFRIVLPVLAVALGMVSTFPTLISVMWMEEEYGLRHTGKMFDDFLFFMGSVGPREEIVKLVFVVPLLPILLIRKSRLEVLIASGCVGLGFAIWENMIYFAQYGPAVAFPRFLTANFFHLALTGLNGLALYDLLRNPVRGALPFLGTLLLTTLAHGGYDFLASIRGMPLMVLGSMVVFMLISLWFFRKLHALRDGSTDQVSIAGTFVLGISLLAGLILILAAREMSLIPTLAIFGITGFGMIMVGYMFYWQLGEGMSAAGEESVTQPYYR